jgi:hypothetical protein
VTPPDSARRALRRPIIGAPDGLDRWLGRPYLTSMVHLAMTVWAYEELVHGSNWFRQLLGGAFMIILTAR